MKHLIAVMACVLMMVCVTGAFARGGGEQAQGGGQLRIAVILKTLSSPYWQTVLSGAERAGKDFNVKIEAFGPPTEDGVEEQINMVQNAIQNKFDAIVFSPCQPPAAVSVLNQTKQAGIPVVVIDTPMPADFQNYVTFIGSNNYQIGVIGAQEMLKVLNAGAKILVLEGAPGNPTMTDRANGAEKVFRDAGMNIVSRQPAYSDRDRAYGITQNVLQTTDIDAVWGSNDDQASGALRAITQAGKSAVVVGVDGNQFALESVRDGGLYATVAQSAEQMGYLGVQYAIDAINGKSVAKQIDAPTPVVTKANVGEFLK
ncbi:MAG: sugar ABC transporter substrate-binding protein [Treponema sp.]|jgi:ribose transport system substrate-binding protein|nr:sugar ABC transporter substrate-binding protein [Treponema sp.]